MENRPHTYIMRNGELERVWEYKIVQHGFNSFVYCRGTESEVIEYIEGEYPEAAIKSWHHSMSEEEVEMLGKLHITIYIAPQK